MGSAQVLTRRHGDHHLAPGPAPRPPTRACLAAFSGTSSRALGPLAPLTSGLAWGPSNPGSFASLTLLTGHLHPMMRGEPLAPVVAHLRGAHVEWHLGTRQSIGGNTRGRGSADATTIGETEHKRHTFWTNSHQFVRNSYESVQHSGPHSCIWKVQVVFVTFQKLHGPVSRRMAWKPRVQGSFAGSVTNRTAASVRGPNSTQTSLPLKV